MATKRKEMLKQTLTGLAFTFLGLLHSVKGNEGFSEGRFSYDSLDNLIAVLKDNCPDHQDLPSCLYYDFNELTDIQLSDALKSKETEDRTRGKKLGEKEIPEENSQETLTEFPENRLHKRLLVQRRKNPTARGYKRGPGFRSWGGKRDWTSTGQNIDKKNNKFGPWGGKRGGEFSPDDFSNSDSEEWVDKRGKFLSWGGKRSSLYFNPMARRGSIWKDSGFYQSEPFIKNVPKRPQFQSWGGKRALYPWHKVYGFLNSLSPKNSINTGEKRKFSSWGGKRYEKNGNNLIKQVFQNWGGKRQSSEEEPSVEDTYNPKKLELDNHATQANKSSAMKTDWENKESSLISNASWDGNGIEERNMR